MPICQCLPACVRHAPLFASAFNLRLNLLSIRYVESLACLFSCSGPLQRFPAAGTPTAPGTPTLTNEISPTKQLKAVFTIPGNANDNAGKLARRACLCSWRGLRQGLASRLCAAGAGPSLCLHLNPSHCAAAGQFGEPAPVAEKYTYDVVRVDTPSVAVPQSATASATGYTFLSAHTNKDVVVDATTFDGTTRTIALSITGLDDALYRVRVNSVNPNSQDPARSQWSAPIGTGEACDLSNHKQAAPTADFLRIAPAPARAVHHRFDTARIMYSQSARPAAFLIMLTARRGQGGRAAGRGQLQHGLQHGSEVSSGSAWQSHCSNAATPAADCAGNPVAPVITSDVVDNVASGTTLNVELDKPNVSACLGQALTKDVSPAPGPFVALCSSHEQSASIWDARNCAALICAAMWSAAVRQHSLASPEPPCPAPAAAAGRGAVLHSGGGVLQRSAH